MYIGRTCHWKDCRPGVRRSCDALHCGRRPYLHDDLDAITLNSTLVLSPPVTLWPFVDRRGELPPDVEEVVAALEEPGTMEPRSLSPALARLSFQEAL
jgi:hypothetical protein